MLQGMELTRTNRSGGLTTYISRRERSRARDRRHAASHAAVRGAPGEGPGRHAQSSSTHSDACPRARRMGHAETVTIILVRRTRHCHRAPAACSAPLETAGLGPAGLRTSFFLATIPERSHPFPSRTRKLSSPGPMVLQGQPCGRVGRCRGFEGPLERAGLHLFSASLEAANARATPLSFSASAFSKRGFRRDPLWCRRVGNCLQHVGPAPSAGWRRDRHAA